MARRGSARAIAVLVVLTSIISAAWGQLVVTDPVSTSRRIPSLTRNNVGTNTPLQLAVECVPGLTSVSAPLFVQQLTGGSGGPTLATTQLQCGGGSGSNTGMIAIVDDVTITMPPGTGAADVISLGQPAERLISASLTPGSPVVFADPNCVGSQTCAWTGSGEALPRQLAVRCNAPGNASLQVFGSTSGSSAGVACIDSGGGPVIQVPANVMSPTIPVTMTSSTTFQIANTGVAPLDVAPLSFPPPWSGNSGCITGCTVGSGGTTSVGVAFSPLDWQPDPYIDTLVVSSNATNAPSANITLTGTGQGGTLEVTEPEVSLPNNLVIDFRRIARGPAAELPLELYAEGNLPTVTAMLAGLAPPFSATPASLGLGAGMTGAFTVRCGSDVPLPPIERTITIESTAYEITPTTQVTLKCEVLDTRVTVTPTTFAFDEVRVGTTAVTKSFTVRNDGTSPARIDAIRLSGSSPVLTIDPGRTGMLPAGDEITGSLTVTPSSEAEVALDLEVEVDGLVLAYPVTAKVVTPHAYITPTSLELGTVCLGTQASGEVIVTNDGTATLKLAEPPTMDMAFIPFYDTIYPYELMPRRTVSAEIRPASATAGIKVGTLAWTVDPSLPPFAVPVSLETIDEGTAISPGKVAVGSWDVGTRSPDRVVRLENCSLAPVEILHHGVVSTRGRADAWDVRPETDARVLAPHDTMLITVAFAPPEAGTYRADLALEIDGQQRLVPLEAEAVGRVLDQTSFYACSCAGGGSPARGVMPIAVAILLVVRRRRRSW
ncbi:MAG: choice-of-anchor D domain-containing protein [Kofleriaceae bacterium]